jgi:hypothetical protein
VPCFIYDNPSDFTIVAIAGNTLCKPTTAGQTAADILPCKVCSAGTAECPDTGDPNWNDAQPGSVQFSFTEYVLREIDAANSPLLDQAGVVWLDLCDSEASQLPNNNCNGVTQNLTQGPSAIFVVAPAVTLDVACTDINQCHPEGEDPEPCVSTVSLTVSNPTGGAPVDPDLTATGCSFTSTFMGAEIYDSQTDGYSQYGFRECGTCSLDPAQVCFANSDCSGGANTCDLVDSQNFCLEHGEEHTAMFETGEFDSTKSLSAEVSCDTGVVVNNSPDTDICQCETPVCSKTVCPDPDVVNLN